jgi:probable addiction module antidote protein
MSTVELIPFDAARYLDSEKAIAAYLDACMEDDDPELLVLALGDVARARGMTELARRTGLARENLCRAFDPGRKPQFDTVAKIADALGLRLSLTPKTTGKAETKTRPRRTRSARARRAAAIA